jgi:dCMP deaminase
MIDTANTHNKWDTAHMEAAEVYANLSTAKRLKVGAVIVKDHRIISIGYNGMPSGWDNTCEDYYTMIGEAGNRFIETKTKPEVLHAESNAIAKVARSAESCEDSTLYCTHQPCLECAKLIHQAGITRVVYRYPYRLSEGLDFLNKCNISVESW